MLEDSDYDVDQTIGIILQLVTSETSGMSDQHLL